MSDQDPIELLAGDGDGRVHDPARVADLLAIKDLSTSYAHAVDDRDWVRWEALFEPDAMRSPRRPA